MSHYTVLVPAADEEELAEKLLPYYEYGCSYDMDERIKPWLEFRVEIAKDDVLAEVERLKQEYPDEYSSWKSPELILQAAHGGEFNLNGDLGYWQNPNKKWDWYSIGGRWTGSLFMKSDENGVLAPVHEAIYEEMAGHGEPGLMTEPCSRIDRVDFAPAELIDWEAMREQAAERAAKRYDAYHSAKSEHGDDNKALHSALCQAGYFLDKNEVEELESETRESLKEKERQDALFFAFIDLDGKWHERGRMGWFAIVTDEQDSYPADFWKFVESLPDEQRIYVVDCHI